VEVVPYFCPVLKKSIDNSYNPSTAIGIDCQKQNGFIRAQENSNCNSHLKLLLRLRYSDDLSPTDAVKSTFAQARYAMDGQ
jgi:hypothetical protein